MERIQAYLAGLRDDGSVFMTPSLYQGTPAIRAALSNWQTEQADIELATQALEAAYQTHGRGQL